jgi:hypothetical protein
MSWLGFGSRMISCWNGEYIMKSVSRIVGHAPGLLCAVLVLAVVLVSCSTEEGERPVSSPASAGFSFFDLTADSRLDSSLRNVLREKIGSDAITQKSPLSLEIPYEGFLKDYFSELDFLNKGLNYSPRERIEHNVTKLMYRYPKKNQLPFDYIELIFSNYTSEPLVFLITGKKEQDTVLQTLFEKYGPSSTVSWNEGKETAHYWKKPGQWMIVSLLQDRFGNPEMYIQIIFSDHIEELIRTEEKERMAKTREKEKAVRSAF